MDYWFKISTKWPRVFASLWVFTSQSFIICLDLSIFSLPISNRRTVELWSANAFFQTKVSTSPQSTPKLVVRSGTTLSVSWHQVSSCVLFYFCDKTPRPRQPRERRVYLGLTVSQGKVSRRPHHRRREVWQQATMVAERLRTHISNHKRRHS